MSWVLDPDDQLVCLKTRLHRRRLLELLEHGPARGISFDEEAADRAVTFIHRNLKHWKSPLAGKPFKLSPFQEFDIIRPLFGFKNADGNRIFREAYLQMPRKNGKSALAAAVLLIILFTDGHGLEVYTAATKRDQAAIVFKDCKAFVKASPALKKRSRVLTNSIEIPRTDSVLKPLSADYNSMDGLNVAGASIDELHAHQSADLHDVIITATGTRSQPLVVKPTTAGNNIQSVCKDQYDYSTEVLKGVVKDDSFFCFIAEADPELDWTDPKAYQMANPNMGVTVSEEYLANHLQKAKTLPSFRRTFQKYHLDRWAEAGDKVWLDLGAWRRNKRPFTRADLAGLACYGGLDLSSNTDLTSLGLLFPWEDGAVRLVNWYWLPEENLAKRVQADKVPYDVWLEQGWLTTTPGDVVDFAFIVRDVLAIREKFKLKLLAYDDWNALPVQQGLQDAGLPMVNFIQGTKSYHTPSSEWERRILDGSLHHDGNPITAWCVQNVKVRVDASDKIRPVKDKKSSRQRIDGVVAGIMGLDCLIRCHGREPKPIDFTALPGNFRALAGL